MLFFIYCDDDDLNRNLLGRLSNLPARSRCVGLSIILLPIVHMLGSLDVTVTLQRTRALLRLERTMNSLCH